MQSQQTINQSRLKMKRRLAADILKCGKQRIWMNPDNLEEIAFATNRRAIQRLIEDRVIVRKPMKIRTRFKIRRKLAAIKKGRHQGPGAFRGSRNARHNRKKNWMRRVRVLRHLLHRYRESGKISPGLHRNLYLEVKGGNFRTKKALMEQIFKLKQEEKRQQQLLEEIEAKRRRAILVRRRKQEREEDRIARKVRAASQAAEMLKEAMRLEQAKQRRLEEEELGESS